MNDLVTAMARIIALENGARFTAVPGVAYDTADPALALMAGALLRQVQGTGIDLLALRWEGNRLIAEIDDSEAEEPLCPLAFNRVVRQLSHRLLGEVWEGHLAAEAPAPVKEAPQPPAVPRLPVAPPMAAVPQQPVPLRASAVEPALLAG